MEALDFAVKKIHETRQLLDRLITSSESFDYRKAKVALKALQKMSRDLEKAQKEFQSAALRPPNIRVVDFCRPGTATGER